MPLPNPESANQQLSTSPVLGKNQELPTNLPLVNNNQQTLVNLTLVNNNQQSLPNPKLDDRQRAPLHPELVINQQPPPNPILGQNPQLSNYYPHGHDYDTFAYRKIPQVSSKGGFRRRFQRGHLGYNRGRGNHFHPDPYSGKQFVGRARRAAQSRKLARGRQSRGMYPIRGGQPGGRYPTRGRPSGRQLAQNRRGNRGRSSGASQRSRGQQHQSRNMHGRYQNFKNTLKGMVALLSEIAQQAE